MPSIPVLSRLTWVDYRRLALAIILLLLEGVLRFCAWILPVSLLDAFRFRFFRRFSCIFRGVRGKEIHELRDPMAKAKSTPELIRFHGYESEPHLVLTSDGYVLQMFRVLTRPPTPAEKDIVVDLPSPSSSPPSEKMMRSTKRRPPVLALHGCMLSSEIWVCQRKARANLVLRLVDEGYDVWLANRRGTLYSQKHLVHKPYQEQFWDFSLDEPILHDIPALVEYIISISGETKVSLLGFSQGSAESLGSLAFSRRLRKHVSCVIGLSATAKPPTPRNALIQSMVHWTPELLFLLFGRRSMLKSVYFWQAILSPAAMSWLMDLCMYLLFGWHNKNIRSQDKPLMYRHLFALASVKQIAHWFQIMRAGKFQMFDDMASTSCPVAPEYPIRNIRIPMLLYLGELDCLADRNYLRDNIDKDLAEIHICENYEHMDSIWAHDAHMRIHPRIIEFLETHCPQPLKFSSRISSSNTSSVRI